MSTKSQDKPTDLLQLRIKRSKQSTAQGFKYTEWMLLMVQLVLKEWESKMC